MVVVVNEPPTAPAKHTAANQETFAQLEGAYGAGERIAGNITRRVHPVGTLVTIDRTAAHSIPSKQGVGLARKIGFDFALAAATQTGSDVAYLHGTDADALLPRDYFVVDPGAAAIVHPFRHLAEGTDGETVFAYEASLRYYVAGLRYAGSAYAFHTIGSLVSVSPQAYAAVRGVPKRNGAEDFYLLNKVAKVGHVGTTTGEPVRLSGRRSDRVPFGTGPAVTKFKSRTDAMMCPVYNPALFQEVQSAVADNPGLDAFQTLKLVHRLRDEQYPNVPLREALQAAPFFKSTPSGTAQGVCEQFAQMEHSAALTSSHLRDGDRTRTSTLTSAAG